MPKESNFKISGRIKNNQTGYDEDFKLFVKGLDKNHAVMIAKDYLRRNAPVQEDGKLPGNIIIENIQEKFSS
ncbi:MAG: hypothetical protein G3M70_14705 [Candidatus Nitronauta litoralis]|uniref:Uncharacterized protein n=1 Tax=Candidatus Nitronauta litoralis TaxID=2705533 RepID=A0A7T0BY14_9BACT|nr:MAG: hypothetical protein G3M70_14705 [Candidatus Nitronauta litoralis]